MFKSFQGELDDRSFPKPVNITYFCILDTMTPGSSLTLKREASPEAEEDPTPASASSPAEEDDPPPARTVTTTITLWDEPTTNTL